jgi:hypothetical protein
MKSTPIRGVKENLKPRTKNLSEPYVVPSGASRVTACLLLNESATYFLLRG